MNPGLAAEIGANSARVLGISVLILLASGTRQKKRDITMISPNEDLLSFAVNRENSQRSIELPGNFPNVDKPRFNDGEKLRWIPQAENTDWGVVLGRFYNYAPHRRRWLWCYLIWLDKNSPSASWILADTAWEEDLELL